uniref:Uncharacterized protein n=1 Tax=Triticum urartu TaxID=4572 RepID=A0A8R7JWM3_TRIUA
DEKRRIPRSGEGSGLLPNSSRRRVVPATSPPHTIRFISPWQHSIQPGPREESSRVSSSSPARPGRPPPSGADQTPPDPNHRHHHLRSTPRVDPGRHCRRRTPGVQQDSPLHSSELYSRQCGQLWRAVHLTPVCSSTPAPGVRAPSRATSVKFMPPNPPLCDPSPSPSPGPRLRHPSLGQLRPAAPMEMPMAAKQPLPTGSWGGQRSPLLVHHFLLS